MTATRSKPPLEALAAALVVALAGCSPSAPPGVSQDDLDAAISRAVGDPNTCVLIAERSGRVLYRYNTATTCANKWPACDHPGEIKLETFLRAALKDGQPRQLSCNSAADGSRGVGWASGPIAGTPYVFAAVMEGERAFPGRMMAERLDGAFRRAKLTPSKP